MPGRYSHSVVLADYTTRGIISLPDDQYERYKEFVPAVPDREVALGKLSRSRSAQPIYQPPTSSQEGWETVDLRKARQSLSANTTPVRARGDDYESRNRQRSNQRLLDTYRDRPAKSTPAINSENRAPSLTAYQRQQQHALNGENKATYEKNLVNYLGLSKPEKQSDYTNSKHPKSSPGTKQDTIPPNVDRRPRPLVNAQATSSGSSQTLRGSSIAKVPTRSSVNENLVSRSKNVSGQADSSGLKELQIACQKALPITPTTPSFPTGYQSPSAQHGAISPMIYLDQVGRSRSSESRISHNTQIWSPKPKPDVEPNFDGFSDQDDRPQSYFDIAKQFSLHSRDSSANSTLPIQRPESSEEYPIASPPVSSVRSGRVPNTPSEATVDSSHYQRSASSKSSMSVLNGTNKDQESTRSPQQQSLQEKSWALPEIKEDLGFSPSIFEDQEGSSNPLKLDFLDLELTIGQISSGKDVNFDNDAASELSAALPPPISRFKDEEDEFNSNMARMFGGSNDQAIRKGSMTVGRRTSNKKGFFSKFRSKS